MYIYIICIYIYNMFTLLICLCLSSRHVSHGHPMMYAPVRLGSASSSSTKNPSSACAKARNGMDFPGILRLGGYTMK